MNVLLLSKYPRIGASSRLRSLQYLPALAEEGIEVVESSLFDEQYVQWLYSSGRRSKLRSLMLYFKRLLSLFGVFRYDLLWIEYEIFPYFPAFMERLLRVVGIRYVVDYDDAVFHSYDCSEKWWVRKILGRKIDTVMRNANCVIAGNRYLAARACSAGAPYVEVIPTVVDHSRYCGRKPGGLNQPLIGWVGSPSTQQYVVDIAEALQRVCEETGAVVCLVGATEEVIEQLPGVPVELVRWSEDSEASVIAKMDVGIMPLKDGLWEKGKCGYKLIQYMASAVPVVASPVGVNVELIDKNKCGRLAASLKEWEACLQEILQSPELQSEYGAAGRLAVYKEYSLQVQAPRLASIFRRVAKTGAVN